MSEAPIHDTPAVDSAIVEPSTTVAEVSSDSIKPTGTDALDSESRPEHATTAAEDTTATPAMPTEEKISESEVKVSAQPVAEGILGYKGPGLLKGLRFSKKFCWFGDETPIEEKHLFSYLSNEKAEIAHPTIAHATQTGKGLFFYAKRVEDKAAPTGIFNLAEASDVTKMGFDQFTFVLHSHRHIFQATSTTECDGWIVAIETGIRDAKAAQEGVTSSDGYKKQLSKYKPAGIAVAAGATGVAGVAAAAAVATNSSTAPTTEAVPEAISESKATATGTTTTEPKVSAKSRSQSRKRQSVFGKILGKKDDLEEKKEIKKEEKAETKEVKKGENTEAVAESGAAGTSAPLDAEAVAAAVIAAPVTEAAVHAPVEGSKAIDAVASTGATEALPATTTTPSAVTPTATKPKRSSVFGSFFGKKDGSSPLLEKKEKDIVPAVPAKDIESTPAVAATAPQLDPVPTSEPTTAEATNLAETTETPAVAESASVAAAPTTAVSETKEKRRVPVFGTLSSKKERKAETTDVEVTDADGKKSPSNVLGSLFRRASRSVKGTSPAHDTAAPPVPTKDISAVAEKARATETTPLAAIAKEPETATPVEGLKEAPTNSAVPEPTSEKPLESAEPAPASTMPFVSAAA